MIETQPSSSLASTPETHSDGGITGDRLEDGGSTAEGFFKELRAVSSTEHTSVVRSAPRRRESLSGGRIPPRELSIDLVADERLGRVTGRAGAS